MKIFIIIKWILFGAVALLVVPFRLKKSNVKNYNDRINQSLLAFKAREDANLN